MEVAVKNTIIKNRETGLELCKTMVRMREFEEKLFFLFSTRQMPGSMHQYNGQEAVGAGVCANLNNDDYVTSTHRGHGHCIAKGADVRAVMAEMFAKSTGCCKGMGGSMHIADFSVGMLGANSIVDAGIPIATGAGWTCKTMKKKQVSVAFFGDGAANEGAFHEGINLASVWKLPVLYVCENNLYGFSTYYKRTMSIDDISERAASYGITGETVDGMDIESVYDAAKRLIKQAREGKGPALLECKTYRFRGHSRFEPANYRPKGEAEEWKKRDPISIWSKRLKERFSITDKVLEEITKEAVKEMDDAVEFSENSPDPNPQDYRNYIFA